jgi:hypothetical protein
VSEAGGLVFEGVFAFLDANTTRGSKDLAIKMESLIILDSFLRILFFIG